LALAGRYFIGAGDYQQGLDVARKSIRLAAARGDYAPDKVDNMDLGPAEGDMLLLADAYRGLGQPEMELPLSLGLYYRKPEVGYFKRRLAEANKALGQNEAAERWLDRADPTRTLVGKPAPDFTLPAAGAGGGQVSLKDALKGRKAVVVNFWFYACGPCRAEAPHLQKVYADLKDKGLEIVSINHDDTPANVEKFASQYGVKFPMVMGGSDKNDHSDVFSRYGVRGYPTNLLLDPTGKIVWYTVGYDEEQIDKLREELGKLGVK
jgi:thiol-disulfide isomerase/thioredoxin